MKAILLFIVLLGFACNGSKSKGLYTKMDTIALQPLGNISMSSLGDIRKEISTFFNRPVIILPPIQITITFFNFPISQLNADSIISTISRLHPNPSIEVVGITNENIYITKEPNFPILESLKDEIFGLGYQAGNVCVASDYKLQTGSNAEIRQGLFNIVVHEIGHNLGLAHCANPHCIMSNAYGDTSRLDKGNAGYCIECRRRLLKL